MAIRQLLEGRVKTLYMVHPKGCDFLRSKQIKFVERKNLEGACSWRFRFRDHCFVILRHDACTRILILGDTMHNTLSG